MLQAATDTEPEYTISQRPIAGPMPHTDEWYALRSMDTERDVPVILGASEAAAVCGMSPYSTPLHLYLQKRKELDKVFTDDQRERMDFGLKLEPIILEAYAQRQDVQVEAGQPMFFHADHRWMACTPDAVAFSDSSEWGIECKCTNWRMYDASGEGIDAFGEDGTDQVPMIYLLQVQWQMAVMGWDRVDLPVLFDGSKLRIYTVLRDETIISMLIERGADMVRRIATGNPPDPTWEHDGTKDALRALYGNKDSGEVELEEDHDLWWWQYQELGGQIKELESRRSVLYNRLIAGMRGAPTGLLPNGQKLKLTEVKESLVTQEDVLALADKVGQVKRKGYQRLSGPRAKK